MGYIVKTISNERIIPVDVDDTLVMHDFSAIDETILISDPYSDGVIEVRPNRPMLRILQDEKARGAFIIVWSRGGFAWAKAVVEALELQNYVDLVMTKPIVYLDDKDIGEWLKDRVYIKPDVKYKQTT